MSLENSKKTGIKQLIRQFQEQQYTLEQNNTSPQLPTLLKSAEPIIIKPVSQLTNSELNELIDQLRKLKLSAVELTRIALIMPFLESIRQDPNQYTQLLR